MAIEDKAGLKKWGNAKINREIDIKSKSRSKLYNRDDFTYKGWVGISKLQYRLPNAQRLLKDIFDGLGASNV